MRGAHAGLLDGLLAAGVAAWMFARCQSSTPPPCCPACFPLRASYPCSEDSATRKARQAAARLKDFGEEEVQQRQQGASGAGAAAAVGGSGIHDCGRPTRLFGPRGNDLLLLWWLWRLLSCPGLSCP